jgi:hypothetical protein
MILYWFTQPKNSFSSYYQYDTVTQKFSRVRLELGRSGSDGGKTFVSYHEERWVTFSKTPIAGAGKQEKGKSRWSVNDDNEFCYDGKPLPAVTGKPAAGLRVYDTSDPAKFIHPGNPTTDTPKLPPDIMPDHLALLANDAIITGQYIELTPGTASESQLSLAIQNRVCDVLGVPQGTFSKIDPKAITAKLVEQSTKISGVAVSQSTASTEKALTSVKESTALVNEQIVEGQFTPTQKFEDAFASMQSSVASAEKASGSTDVEQVVMQVEKASQEVTTAITDVVTAENEVVTTQLDSAKASLSEAGKQATTTIEVQKEYEPLSKATTPEEYMDTMSGDIT